MKAKWNSTNSPTHSNTFIPWKILRNRMAIDLNTFEKLGKKYGDVGSWAIWNPSNAKDTGIIAENMLTLKPSIVMGGLNISAFRSETWSNFRGGKNDRKLIYAFNDSPYRGAYMTDLIKGEIEPKSYKLIQMLRSDPVKTRKHIEVFRDEMSDIGADSQSLFILFGGYVSNLFAEHLGQNFANSVSVPHYARHGTDLDWLEDTWKILEDYSRESNPAFKTKISNRNHSMRDVADRLRR
ncbi:MAG: hypothetical protein IPL32_14610 [Chloracidobacterium sp.]|nr:hypothetical protein [Chloracidobacterium sp.]